MNLFGFLKDQIKKKISVLINFDRLAAPSLNWKLFLTFSNYCENWHQAAYTHLQNFCHILSSSATKVAARIKVICVSGGGKR